MAKEKEFREKKRGVRISISLFGILVLLVVVAVVVSKIMDVNLFSMIFSGNDHKVTTISESSLEDVIEISDLSTVEYFYNSITEVHDEETGDLKYHVAYEGVVDAGISLNDVKVSVDNEKKIITITLPQIEIQNVSVDIGTLSYIFEDDDYNTETVSQEAYKACKKDLKDKAEKKQALFEMAKTNAEEAMRGLIEPWVKQTDKSFVVDIKTN